MGSGEDRKEERQKRKRGEKEKRGMMKRCDELISKCGDRWYANMRANAPSTAHLGRVAHFASWRGHKLLRHLDTLHISGIFCLAPRFPRSLR